MALTVDINSYVTLIEALVLAEEHPQGQSFIGESSDNQEVLLIGAYYSLKANPRYCVPSSTADDSLKKAQVWLAVDMLSNGYLINSQDAATLAAQSGIKSQRRMSRAETYGDNVQDARYIYSLQVEGFLQTYLCGKGLGFTPAKFC